MKNYYQLALASLLFILGLLVACVHYEIRISDMKMQHAIESLEEEIDDYELKVIRFSIIDSLTN